MPPHHNGRFGSGASRSRCREYGGGKGHTGGSLDQVIPRLDSYQGMADLDIVRIFHLKMGTSGLAVLRDLQQLSAKDPAQDNEQDEKSAP